MDRIEKIYAGKVVEKYDLSMSHFFGRYKSVAFDDSSLKYGDNVLVFCCGTGLDFPYILSKIGKDGQITGVDFSSEMLNKANNRIRENKWENVELIQADISEFKGDPDKKYDAGVCTLGMSIIPEYRKAYYNLCSHIKERGEIIIGDMKLASGWLSLFNPLTVLLSKKYGGSYEGHENSMELFSLMEKELTHLRKKEFFLGSYFYCIGAFGGQAACPEPVEG